MSSSLRNSTNLRRGGGGLKASNIPRLGVLNKPKPLGISTNTIHSLKQPKSGNLKHNKEEKNKPEPVKKKVQTPHTGSKTTGTSTVDENTDDPFAQDPYDPLLDVYPLDEQLYQKVLKLELADDGLPSFKIDEPFDF